VPNGRPPCTCAENHQKWVTSELAVSRPGLELWLDERLSDSFPLISY
jgi:hypothetical protein